MAPFTGYRCPPLELSYVTSLLPTPCHYLVVAVAFSSQYVALVPLLYKLNKKYPLVEGFERRRFLDSMKKYLKAGGHVMLRTVAKVRGLTRATSEASRKVGGVYGVRSGGGSGSSDVMHGSSGDGCRYPVNAPSKLVASLLTAPHLLKLRMGS